MKTENYNDQQAQLPTEGKYIVASYDQTSIVVYQAFEERITQYAVDHQKFGGKHYSFSRMTWIKPNFMWMMYRSGWARKVKQERILAIRIKRSGFEQLLENAVASSFQASAYEEQAQWKAALATSDVRLQWDPDHNPRGEKLARKAIQIGLKGETLQRFNDEWICQIEDITRFVHQQRPKATANFDQLLVPVERVLPFKNKPLCQQIGLEG